MKKLIRAIIKIPATPFVVVFLTGAMAMCYVTQFYEWVYEVSDFSKQITSEMKSDIRNALIWWFTTI